MKTILEHAQKAGDDLEKEGLLTEETKKTFPRPETPEDAYKILIHANSGFGYGFGPSPLAAFLFGMLLSPSLGGWPILSELELKNLLTKDDTLLKEESQDEKIDE